MTSRERAAADAANVLLVNFLTLCEQVRLCGGSCLLEHPADPKRDPYPSIFATELVLRWCERIGGEYMELDQCMYGGIARKPTGLISDMLKMKEGLLR